VTSATKERIDLNVVAVAKAAAAYEVPVVLSTVGVDLGVNQGTETAIVDELPGVGEIDRTGVNAWEDEDFRSAIEATGRKKVVIAGLWTEVCLTFPTLDMLAEGYEVYPVVDAVGGISRVAHESALQRIVCRGCITGDRDLVRRRAHAQLGPPRGRPSALDHGVVLPAQG
jgi:nicotinamidase-related amidase